MHLRTLRKRFGWTQEELERRSKVAQNSISRLENDPASRPAMVTVLALAKAFGVDPLSIEFGPPRTKLPRRSKAAPDVVPA
jgi:transcriptional regulator with XRE-family HTH domain